MNIRADYTPGYFRRFILIAIACFAFTAWCFYDALVKYPAQLKQSEIYWELDQETRYDKWREITREKRWSSATPDQPDEIRHKIDSQYFYAAISVLIGLPCLIKWFRARGTWVEADKKGLRASWGPALQFEQMQSIDKTKWSNKGIAKIRYGEDGGRNRTFVLDDFKYDRQSMGEIIRRVEENLKDDQFIGGQREPDPDEKPLEMESEAGGESD